MTLRRAGMAAAFVAGLLLAAGPATGLPMPSRGPDVPPVPAQAAGEATLAGESTLAVLLLAAAIASGGDEDKARAYGLTAVGIWLVWLTIDEYVNAPEEEIPLPVIY